MGRRQTRNKAQAQVNSTQNIVEEQMSGRLSERSGINDEVQSGANEPALCAPVLKGSQRRRRNRRDARCESEQQQKALRGRVEREDCVKGDG